MSRRVIDMVTTAILIVGLGFIIAVSARTLPGGDEGDVPLGISVSFPEWIGRGLGLILLAATAVASVSLLLLVARTAPRQRPKARRWLGLLVWIVVFLLAYRFARPAVDEAVSGTLPPLEDGEPVVDTPVATAAGWVVSVLIAAVIAAALTRIGFLVRGAGPLVEAPAEQPATPADARSSAAPPVSRPTGRDPVSRVINAYADFEDAAGTVGYARASTETTGRHARRVGESLGLDRSDVAVLADHYSTARFADHGIDETKAAAAESARDRVNGRISE